jgi:hypothetical protein
VVANGGATRRLTVERIGNHINPVMPSRKRQVITPTRPQMTAMMEVVVYWLRWKSLAPLRWTRPVRRHPQIPVKGKYTEVWAPLCGPPAKNPVHDDVVIRKPNVPAANRLTLNDGYFTAAPVWRSPDHGRQLAHNLGSQVGATPVGGGLRYTLK